MELIWMLQSNVPTNMMLGDMYYKMLVSKCVRKIEIATPTPNQLCCFLVLILVISRYSTSVKLKKRKTS